MYTRGCVHREHCLLAASFKTVQKRAPPPKMLDFLKTEDMQFCTFSHCEDDEIVLQVDG